MAIYPLKRLLIVYGLHLADICQAQTEERVYSNLTRKGFISEELFDLDILVFKNPAYTKKNFITHIVIDFNSLVSDIHYYNKKE